MLGRISFSALATLLAVVIALFISEAAAAPAPHGAITLPQLTKAFAGHCPKRTSGDAITCKDALPYINAAIKK